MIRADEDDGLRRDGVPASAMAAAIVRLNMEDLMEALLFALTVVSPERLAC